MLGVCTLILRFSLLYERCTSIAIARAALLILRERCTVCAASTRVRCWMLTRVPHNYAQLHCERLDAYLGAILYTRSSTGPPLEMTDTCQREVSGLEL
jgi:hypothetical protein